MIKILIIDDHAIFVSGIRRVLNDEPNMTVVADADNMDDALRVLARGGCTLALLDITLADELGLEVLRKIQAKFPKFPVIMLSMHPETQYARSSRELGARGYVCKDARAEQLILAIRTVAAGNEYFRNFESAAGLPHESLSDRESEVFLSIARGESLTHVGKRLGLSVKTIATYRSRVLEKLDLHTNAAITHYAVKNKLIVAP